MILEKGWNAWNTDFMKRIQNRLCMAVLGLRVLWASSAPV
jgi:hypothetical protein